ncbi:MAG: hypothetical protein IJ014_03145 [Rikenellaceae bacterium]|nr:hypothetical protein [Rikenellaceae bacterium]
MKKLFVAMLAVAGLVACEKEAGFDAPIESNNKTVAITIENAARVTKGAAGNTTAATGETYQAVADAADLKILFAAGETILKEMALVGTEVEHKEGANAEYQYGKKPASGINGDYFFHNVPAAVTKVAVVRYETNDITITEGETTLAEVLALATSTINEQREIDDICLYGEGALGAKGDDCVEIDGVQYYIYPAAVTVAPAMARLEISQISCTDLGDDNDDDKLETVGIDELKLNSFEWGGYTIDPAQLGTLVGSYVSGQANSTVEDETKRVCKPATGVWSWNIVPQAFAKMILSMEAKAYDYQLPATDLAINVTGLTQEGADVTSYEAGKIYQLAVNFTEDDIAGQEGVCVDVTVTIQDWVVVPVEPVFGE